MRDKRVSILAKNIVHNAVQCQKGEKVLIEARSVDRQFVQAIVEEVFAAGGLPIVELVDTQIESTLLKGTSIEHIKCLAMYAKYRMVDIDCYIGLRGGENSYELAQVSAENLKMYDKYFNLPVHHKVRVAEKKWVVLRYPSPSMAQNAHMSTEAFEDLYFQVCNVDYKKMDTALNALKALMEKTDKVRIVAKNTDLSFSIQGMPAIKCAGEMNIPDGEIYTAPIKNSLEGKITFNTPAIHKGHRFEEITLQFKHGKARKESCIGNVEALRDILNIDRGARFVGEFAMGINPYLTRGIGDTLFDEKIAGSVHFALGNCYDNAYNGNKSSIHWDLVAILTEQYGGGQIYFDDVLVQENGRFVLKELLPLNVENLK